MSALACPVSVKLHLRSLQSGPAVCRCWSSHVEQRERVSTSHLPAGAHSSLENQVRSPDPGDPAGSLHLRTFTNRPTGLLSVDTHCAGGEAVCGLQHPLSDRRKSARGRHVGNDVLLCSKCSLLHLKLVLIIITSKNNNNRTQHYFYFQNEKKYLL